MFDFAKDERGFLPMARALRADARAAQRDALRSLAHARRSIEARAYYVRAGQPETAAMYEDIILMNLLMASLSRGFASSYRRAARGGPWQDP